MFGLETNAEKGQTISTFVDKMLREVLEIDTATPLVMERAHRTAPAAQSRPGAKDTQRPSAIIVRLLNFKTKQDIMQLSRTKGRLFYKDKRISIFSDCSAELLREKRNDYDGIKRELAAKRITDSLMFPA